MTASGACSGTSATSCPRKATAERLLATLRGRVVQEAERLHAEVEAGNTVLAANTSALSATLTAEARCLRAIVHAVVKHMARQLA